MPVYQLLGGKVRDKIRVYGWIGGDDFGHFKAEAQRRKDQGFTAVKMNATGRSFVIFKKSRKEVINVDVTG